MNIEDNSVKEDKLESNVDLEEKLKNSKNFSLALFYVDREGEIIMMTAGDMSRLQKNIVTKILIVAGDHSLVLRLILNLEILFEKISYRFSEWFKSKFT